MLCYVAIFIPMACSYLHRSVQISCLFYLYNILMFNRCNYHNPKEETMKRNHVFSRHCSYLSTLAVEFSFVKMTSKTRSDWSMKMLENVFVLLPSPCDISLMTWYHISGLLLMFCRYHVDFL